MSSPVYQGTTLADGVLSFDVAGEVVFEGAFSNLSFSETSKGPSVATPSNGGTNGAVAGAAIGSVFAIAIIGVAAVLFVHRKRRKSMHTGPSVPPPRPQRPPAGVYINDEYEEIDEAEVVYEVPIGQPESVYEGLKFSTVKGTTDPRETLETTIGVEDLYGDTAWDNVDVDTDLQAETPPPTTTATLEERTYDIATKIWDDFDEEVVTEDYFEEALYDLAQKDEYLTVTGD